MTGVFQSESQVAEAGRSVWRRFADEVERLMPAYTDHVWQHTSKYRTHSATDTPQDEPAIQGTL